MVGRAVLLLLFSLLAGCATADETPQEAMLPAGSLSGVVVDDAIVPIEGAQVSLVGTAAATATDADGAFRFDNLSPGTYFIEASHPFYDTQQTSAEVGTAATVKLQLHRTVFTQPYLQTQQVAGFVACSSSVQGVVAEECGEGAGVPCDVPVIGCQRLAGQPDNQAQVDFWLDGRPASLQAELVWEPTLVVGGGAQEGRMLALLATEFVCDPVCRYDDNIDNKAGASPLILRDGDGEQGTRYFTEPDRNLTDLDMTPETRFSVFVWASDEQTGVLFQQPFEAFITASYALPLPEGWSFAAGDEKPF